jgi:hypothetical protein
VAGLVICEAEGIDQERPFSPILPVAVLLVRTKSRGDCPAKDWLRRSRGGVDGEALQGLEAPGARGWLGAAPQSEPCRPRRRIGR